MSEKLSMEKARIAAFDKLAERYEVAGNLISDGFKIVYEDAERFSSLYPQAVKEIGGTADNVLMYTFSQVVLPEAKGLQKALVIANKKAYGFLLQDIVKTRIEESLDRKDVAVLFGALEVEVESAIKDHHAKSVYADAIHTQIAEFLETRVFKQKAD